MSVRLISFGTFFGGWGDLKAGCLEGPWEKVTGAIEFWEPTADYLSYVTVRG